MPPSAASARRSRRERERQQRPAALEGLAPSRTSSPTRSARRSCTGSTSTSTARCSPSDVARVAEHLEACGPCLHEHDLDRASRPWCSRSGALARRAPISSGSRSSSGSPWCGSSSTAEPRLPDTPARTRRRGDHHAVVAPSSSAAQCSGVGLAAVVGLVALARAALAGALAHGNSSRFGGERATKSPDGAKGSTDHSCVAYIVAHLRCVGRWADSPDFPGRDQRKVSPCAPSVLLPQPSCLRPSPRSVLPRPRQRTPPSRRAADRRPAAGAGRSGVEHLSDRGDADRRPPGSGSTARRSTSAGSSLLCGARLGTARASRYGWPQDWVGLVVLALLGALTWWLPSTSATVAVRFTADNVVVLAAIPIVGPLGAGVVGLVMAGLTTRRIPAPPPRSSTSP